MKAGTVTGNNYASAATWPGTDNYYSYGGVNDQWGVTRTPDEINDPNFGLAFSAHIAGLVTMLLSAQINHIRQTAYYDLILPVQLIDFFANQRMTKPIFCNGLVAPMMRRYYSPFKKAQREIPG